MFCRRQLAGFQEHRQEFESQGITLLAASVDTREQAMEMAEKTSADFAIGYGLDCLAAAEALGCFYDEKDNYLHAAGFVLDPEGKVAVACYSSGPIGRMQPKNCLDLIRYLRKK
ncbi:redoxin domain-containing protein [Desulfohalovibrio reitneri]|uniref:redoxin domain-containing protein n=1 Tax=Desulfohalovibrio reitneri TaxID=1307759 RepID=UPI0004A73484|nr:redoxin domain-containing protein [Desulfohalovibrio reitneri]